MSSMPPSIHFSLLLLIMLAVNATIGVYPLLNSILSIFDMHGNQVLQQAAKQPQTELNIANLAKGIYIVKVLNDNEIMVSKFIKN